MAKHPGNLKSSERVPKKPKLEAVKKVSIRDVKGTSQKIKPAHSIASSSLKGKEKKVEAPAQASEKAKGKKKSVDADIQPLPSNFKVIAGSYEKLLYGLDGSTAINDDGKLEFHLKPIFIFPAHVSCIKAVAASPHGGKWLATGSADEIIKVWDLRRKKEIGGLMHHEGSITHLTFPSRSHLLSASEDGTLCLFRARDWAVLRTLKGHKGRVNAVAIHPSGKVALSVGKDRALRMWDLMRGKGCASTKLGKEGEIVRWSVDGSMFAVQSGSTIDVHSTNMDPLYTITHPSRLHDIEFCKRSNGKGEVLFAAAEDKKLSVYNVGQDSNPPKIIAQMVGHSNRVKALQTLRIALPPSCGRTSTTIVCTVSSDGKIHIYDLDDIPEPTNAATQEEPIQITPVAEYDSKGTRLTCVTLAEGDSESSASSSGKRKRDDDEAPSSRESDKEDGFGQGLEEPDEPEGEGDSDEEDSDAGGELEDEEEFQGITLEEESD